jgi:prepilin peptidase CpaA
MPMLVIATRFAIGALLVVAAAYDLRSFRIPNPIPVALIALFAVSAAIGVQGTLSPHFASFGIASLLGFGLFAGHIWGGGDTKLISAFALFLTPSDLGRFLLVTTLVGGVIALLVLLAERMANDPRMDRVSIPYGLALAIGGLDWCLLH